MIVSKHGYLANILSEMYRVKLSLQGKQLTVCSANDKIWTSKQQLEF